MSKLNKAEKKELIKLYEEIIGNDTDNILIAGRNKKGEGFRTSNARTGINYGNFITIAKQDICFGEDWKEENVDFFEVGYFDGDKIKIHFLEN